MFRDLNFGITSRISGRVISFTRDQKDPTTGAHVMARGITSSGGSRPTVVSPLHKEVNDLGSGECLGTPELRLQTFGTRIVGGYIEVQV